MERIMVSLRQGPGGPSISMRPSIQASRKHPGRFVGYLWVQVGQEPPYYDPIIDQAETQDQALLVVKAELLTHLWRGTFPERSVLSQTRRQRRAAPAAASAPNPAATPDRYVPKTCQTCQKVLMVRSGEYLLHESGSVHQVIDPLHPSRADKWGYSDAEIRVVMPDLEPISTEEVNDA